MQRIISLLLFFVLISFYSCQNEIDLFTDGPTEAIAYALINPQDSIHILRIQKTYITEIKQEVEVRSEDIYFDSVAVMLSGIKNDEVVWEKEMIKTKWEKDSGYFPGDDHYVFCLHGILPDVLPDPSNPYAMLDYLRINIEIDDIGIQAEANTCVLSPAVIKVDSRRNKQIRLYKTPSVIYLYQERSRINCRPSYGELGFKVYITEYNTGTPRPDSIIWETSNFDFPGYYKYTLTPEKLFNRIMKGLNTDKPVINRKLDSIHLYCKRPDNIFGEYWNTRINRADHDYPPFSNFDNIYGMVICLSTGYETGFYLDQQALDSLCNGEKWKHLKFRQW